MNIFYSSKLELLEIILRYMGKPLVELTMLNFSDCGQLSRQNAIDLEEPSLDSTISEVSESDFESSYTSEHLFNTPNDSTSSENDNEDDNGCVILETSDRYARENFFELRETISAWVKEVNRRVSMQAWLYEFQLNQGRDFAKEISKQNSATCEYLFLSLDALHSRVKRRNEKNRPSYFLAESLCDIFKKVKSSIFFEPSVYIKLCHLLDSWILGCSFTPENYAKIAFFLQTFYRTKDETIKSLYSGWKKSEYHSKSRDYALLHNRTYIENMYFGHLQDSFDNVLKKNNVFLPSIIDVGQTSSKQFKKFLDEFSIPYSGPYKNLDGRNFKVQYFISSFNQSDYNCNNDLPLYGVYEFGLNSLAIPNDEAAKFVNSLSVAPVWLSHVPPLFYSSLKQFRNYLYQNW